MKSRNFQIEPQHNKSFSKPLFSPWRSHPETFHHKITTATSSGLPCKWFHSHVSRKARVSSERKAANTWKSSWGFMDGAEQTGLFSTTRTGESRSPLPAIDMSGHLSPPPSHTSSRHSPATSPRGLNPPSTFSCLPPIPTSTSPSGPPTSAAHIGWRGELLNGPEHSTVFRTVAMARGRRSPQL